MKNTAPFLKTKKAYDWTDGWTTTTVFSVRNQRFLFILKKYGFSGSNKNVHIHRMKNDGTVGTAVKKYKWTEGWSTAEFFHSGGKTYLFILKARGLSGSKKNVHIYQMNSNGTVGPRIKDYKWTEGWTTAKFFVKNNKLYLFLLKKKGLSGSKKNVHVHRMNSNGTVGKLVKNYKWTEGWTTAQFYTQGNTSRLLLLKEKGVSSIKKNVHIHDITSSGAIGKRVKDYKWTEGWTTAEVFKASNGRKYLFLLKKGDGELHIHFINSKGLVGTRVASYEKKSTYYDSDSYGTGSLSTWGPVRWSTGWTGVAFYTIGNQTYMFRIKANSGEAKVASVNPMRSVGPLLGHVTAKSANVWVGFVGGKAVSGYVRYWNKATPNQTKEVSLSFRGKQDSYYNPGTAVLSGLTADSSWHYLAVINGSTIGTGKFKTAPATGSENTFTMAFSSCMDVGVDPKQEAWTKLHARYPKRGTVIIPKPDFQILAGDTAYPNTTERSMQWAEHLQQRGVDNFARVIKSLPTYATWDDHDFGPNNSSGADKEKGNRAEAQNNFRELFANPNYAASQGIYYSFRRGAVEFFVLDERYWRFHYKSATNRKKDFALLGKTQWSWLTRGLINSTATFKVIVSGSTLTRGKEKLNAYTADYAQLLKLIRKVDGVLLLSGDIHECQIVKNHKDKLKLLEGYNLVEVISSGVGRAGDKKYPNGGFATLKFEPAQDKVTIWTRKLNGDILDSKILYAPKATDSGARKQIQKRSRTNQKQKTRSPQVAALEYFNRVTDPEDIVARIMDDPAYGSASSRAYGVRISLAKRILTTRKKLPGNKFASIQQIDAIRGIGPDTLHDILHAFE